jgi:uncharacterized membrane protein YphA (DoxX/SURF4 family)
MRHRRTQNGGKNQRRWPETVAKYANMLQYGPAVLRLAVGAVFVAHGSQKLFGVWGGAGGGTARFGQIGLAPAHRWRWRPASRN